MTSRLEYMMQVSVKMPCMTIPLCSASLKISDSNCIVIYVDIASV